MRRLILGRAGNSQLNRHTLTSMYHLRHRVFKEKLGWNVSSSNGEEVDEYDRLDPYYMVVMERDKAIACWRLLPTSGKYMLSHTFTQLLRGDLPPSDKNIWELSRFAVLSPDKHCKAQIQLNQVAFEMFAQLIQFADRQHISQYVTVMSRSVERLMLHNGISLTRFGDGKVTRIEGVPSVACWVNLNAQTRQAVSESQLLSKTA